MESNRNTEAKTKRIGSGAYQVTCGGRVFEVTSQPGGIWNVFEGGEIVDSFNRLADAKMEIRYMVQEEAR